MLKKIIDTKNVRTHILALIFLAMVVTACSLFENPHIELNQYFNVIQVGIVALLISFITRRVIMPYCIPVEYLVCYIIGTIFGIIPPSHTDGAMSYSMIFTLLSPYSIWINSLFLMLVITFIIDIIIVARQNKVPKSLWRDNN